MPTGPSRPPTRNGTRQPQSLIWSGVNTVFSKAAKAEPSSRPATTLICWKLPNRPRRPLGAHSTMNEVEPPHSPPAEKPCISRATSNSNGAKKPMLE